MRILSSLGLRRPSRLTRSSLALLAFAGASLAWSGDASAQTKKSGKPELTDNRGNALGRLVMLHDLEASRQIQVGRARLKQGDCKGALDAFDASLKGSNDPTVRRDRGLCHEKLGHPIPAIEDYRVYLTALPDAQDAPDIRERLERLRGDPAADEKPEIVEDPTLKKGGARASFSVKANSDGVSAGGDTSGGGPGVDVAPSKEMNGHDAARVLDRREKLEARQLESNGSALRKGTGPVLGVAVGPRFWAFENSNRGVDPGYMVAGTIRYSTGPSMSVHGDVGYTSIQGQGTASTFGGLSLLGGLEWRIALDPYVTDALVAGVGLAYERYKVDSAGLVFSLFMPRGRFGYRHVFGPSFALEATADVGMGFGSIVDRDASSFTVVAFGPNVGAVAAF